MWNFLIFYTYKLDIPLNFLNLFLGLRNLLPIPIIFLLNSAIFFQQSLNLFLKCFHHEPIHIINVLGVCHFGLFDLVGGLGVDWRVFLGFELLKLGVYKSELLGELGDIHVELLVLGEGWGVVLELGFEGVVLGG